MRASIRIAAIGLSLVAMSFPGCVAGSRRGDPFGRSAPRATSRVARPSVAERVRAKLARIWERDETPRDVTIRPESTPIPGARAVRPAPRDGVLELPGVVERWGEYED